MLNRDDAIKNFMGYLASHIERKAKLYDGAGEKRANPDISYCIATMAEELGEIASEILRNRLHAARYECVDLAHTALLMFLAIESELYKIDRTL